MSHAFTVLAWQENLASDEMPPEWMWALDEELEEWFEEVEAVRKDKYASPGASSDETEMMSNTLARGKR